MKEYFYLSGKNQNGPFSIEELKSQGLTNETLIWTEGMVDWVRLKEFQELTEKINPLRATPPPPPNMNDTISKTELSGQLKGTSENATNPDLEKLMPSTNTLKWFFIWLAFHLFALVMSYSKISFFNGNLPDEPKHYFWPFVDSYTYENYSLYTGEKGTGFNGIFYCYDWSEFVLYVGGVFIIYLIIKFSYKK